MFYHTMGLQRYIILHERRLKKDYVLVRYGSGKDIAATKAIDNVIPMQ